MGRIFETVERYFKNDDWNGEPIEEGVLAFRLENQRGQQWGCLAIAFEEAEQFAFYSVLLDEAPQERRAEVSEFIMRANHGMQVGNFEMDLDDGEVRFKTSVDVENIELDEQIIRNLVELNLMMMGIYFDGIMAVVSGKKRVLEAIGEIETDDVDSSEPN